MEAVSRPARKGEIKMRNSSWCACFMAALVALGIGCQDDGGGDDANGDTGADSNGPGDDGDGDGDDGGKSCVDACETLVEDPQCALDQSECVASCNGDACATCLSQSGDCGGECVDVCSGGDDGDPDTGNDDSSDDGNIPEPQCVMEGECGLGQECIACGLTDNEGWCVSAEECIDDDDCGIDGKCGYNVESGDYRCLPAAYCG
jgi:hypothetical protein